MPYLMIDDFKLGMDRRRALRVAGYPGSLWVGENVHVTRGGDVERRKKFVLMQTLPANTFGMQAIGTELMVFGSDGIGIADQIASYQQLAHPSGVAMTRVLDMEAFDGKHYVVAEFVDGAIYHYYDGERVTSWDTFAPIESNDDVATTLAARIDQLAGFTATASGSVVTITGQNNDAYTTTATATNFGAVNDQTAAVATTQAAGATQPQIDTVTIGGTFEASDLFTVVVDGNSISAQGSAGGSVGTVVMAFKSKMYALAGSVVHFSALNNPTLWGSGIGSGFINLANQREGQEPLVTMTEYQGLLAFFRANSVPIWNIDEDEDLNIALQTVGNSGAIAQESAIQFSNKDVFYLSGTGVRSLRAREGSDTPYVNDVGTAIDTFLRTYTQTLDPEQVERAVAAIEPIDGRYWLAIGKRIFVFSYFPTSKISAWSYYDLDDEIDADIEWFAKVGQRLYLRAGSKIYLYGGGDSHPDHVNHPGDTYPDDDEAVATIEMPFLSAKTPAGFKMITGMDAAVSGEWTISLLVDPNDETVEVDLGVVNKISFPENGYMLPCGPLTHVAPKLVCSKAGYAAISSVAVHYDGPESQR